MASDLPEDPWIGTALARYFPALLREKFSAYIPRHALKREIVAAHGGQMGVESGSGSGSRFWFTLRVPRPQA